MSTPSDFELQLADAVDAATGHAWRLARVFQEPGVLCLALDTAGASFVPTPPPLVVETWAAQPELRSYRTVGALGFAYRGQDLTRDQLPLLDATINACATFLTERRFDPSLDALPARVGDDEPLFPTPYQRHYLESEVALPDEVIAAYRRDGHVLVRRALNRDVILAARPHLLAALGRAWPPDLPPVAERPDAYSQSFTQITNVGLGDPVVRLFSQARRIARMVADLMGVERVRLFCEDWLVKEPGARITPWHQDEAVFPFAARATVTCWIPIQDVRPGDGLLRFARGSQHIGIAPIENISDISEAEFARIIAAHGFPIDELPPVFVGDVSFHDGRTIHGAFPNTSEAPRVALALHCYADGARIKEATTPKLVELLANSAPGLKLGDLAANERWPLIYDADARPRPPVPRKGAPRYHLRATRLSDDTPVELWIADGRLRLDPIEGAEELAAPGGYVSSGLVECHGHISYPHSRADRVETARWMNERRAWYAATGVLLLRDMGAVGDEISSLWDIPGLPRVHACGNMILRYGEFPFTRTEPSELVSACVERIERGARWVKVFADWTDDYRGRINSGFTGDDEVTYPQELLAEAVAAVHARGGRVAAHCFTRAGAEVSIGAGVDSLEHGWGLDAGLVEELVRRDITWVPLVGIATHMWRVARGEAQADRVAWIEQTMSSLATLLPLAEERGVRVLAGTDMFPEVTVGDEIRQLRELGLSRAAALAAGSWAARAWLGEPGLEEGAPADLVLYRADPRRDEDALFHPELILSGGERVEPSFLHVRPRYVSWRERGSGT